MWPTPVPTPTQLNKTSYSSNYTPALNYSPAPTKSVLGAGTVPMSSSTDPRAANYQPANATPSRQPTGPTGGAIPLTNTSPQSNSELDQLRAIPSGDLNPVQKTRKAQLEAEINNAANSSSNAAGAAAEARRQAAQRAYEGKVVAAGVAKDAAKGQYDWLLGALGSNKQDLLDQVALNETTGTQEYTDQQAKTQTQYDTAKKDILTTYRDLGREQEKILRGAGVQNSSRSMEAQLRLNNLLGKDMSTVSTNEADSLAQIGNALTAFKSKVALTRNSIETDTKNNLDKASLDYNTQVKAIDANLQLSANEREDAYAAAEAQLAADEAEIVKWAAGLKLQVESTIADQKQTLDNFIVDMTDDRKLLGSDLATKTQATEAVKQQITSAITINEKGQLTNPTQGVKQKPAKNLASLYDPNNVGLPGTAASAAGAGNIGTVQNVSARQDPLLASLLGTA